MKNVEVFKTNVSNERQAIALLSMIHALFADYEATFDLEDCDRILRIKAKAEIVSLTPLLRVLNKLGCHAEVLSDDVLSMPTSASTHK